MALFCNEKKYGCWRTYLENTLLTDSYCICMSHVLELLAQHCDYLLYPRIWNWFWCLEGQSLLSKCHAVILAYHFVLFSVGKNKKNFDWGSILILQNYFRESISHLMNTLCWTFHLNKILPHVELYLHNTWAAQWCQIDWRQFNPMKFKGSVHPHPETKLPFGWRDLPAGRGLRGGPPGVRAAGWLLRLLEACPNVLGTGFLFVFSRLFL